MSSPPKRRLLPGQNTPALSESAAVDLVLRIRKGDEQAFQQLFEAWFPLLVGLAYAYVCSRDIANDIAQEAFVGFWDDRVHWQWTGSALGYLQLVVRRRALKELRHAKLEERHGADFAVEGISPASGSAPEASDERVIRGELWDAVSAAVATLPPRMRAVAVLRWFEGVDRMEAAEALGVSVRTVDAQLMSASRAVRIWLSERGFDPNK